ncbi:uncharacterized protein LOC122647970 [Telopea speciosissima]|uniref:uncharacterized protein LOC122647970 n=1 Tax=Telopea speciosissima TaxID=54955 RepID=UPI001CC3A6CE|nr:uncharacterized protein LOC122647970 [Telopea speciosissima]
MEAQLVEDPSITHSMEKTAGISKKLPSSIPKNLADKGKKIVHRNAFALLEDLTEEVPYDPTELMLDFDSCNVFLGKDFECEQDIGDPPYKEGEEEGELVPQSIILHSHVRKEIDVTAGGDLVEIDNPTFAHNKEGYVAVGEGEEDMIMARDNAAAPTLETTDWGGPIRESLLQILEDGDKANGEQSNLKETSTKGKKISGSTIPRGPLLEGGRSKGYYSIDPHEDFCYWDFFVLPLSSAVYALNSLEGRMELWREISGIASGVVEPWAVMGDFNTVRHQNEKMGGDAIHQGVVDEFNSCIFNSGLADLKWRGEFFTWNNNQSGTRRICCKLDRVLVNSAWLDKLRFSEANFLCPEYPDHSPIALNILDNLNSGPKPFRFFDAWTHHKDYDEVVKRGWLKAINVNLNPFLRFAAKLKNVKSELKCWNKESIGDVFKNVKDAEHDLGRIQYDLSLYPLDDSLVVLEKEAKGKLWAALQMEERFLKEKSRVRWPGPDGFGAGFYKHSWEVIGEELTHAVQWFFANSFMPRSINATFITLVPKSGDVSTFAGFRPIALCNLLYKIITKILSNRIQHVIGSVVSHNQSAFIKGRSIVDNILVCHDIVRGIEQKAASPTAVLKVDLHKAYDSLSRKFLFDVMGRMGFSDKFIGPAGFFNGARGIRQGDPLSPYLFTLAMEAFTGIMRRLEIDGQIKLLPRCKSFHLSHLIFADDLMIFVKGNRDSILASLGGLDEFAALSGLQLNRSKSSIILGGLTQTSSLELLDLTGFSETKLPIRYLGVPLVSGRLSMKDCSPILDLVRRKLEGWKARFLSYAGRLQLLASVLQGSYIYWAGIFGLPGNVITKLESMFSNFLWSGPSLQRKTHFISWDAICKPKSEGGLGIKRIKDMNIAGIMKQIWWIASKQDRLWVKWVQQRYLKQESLWTVKGLNNCSWVWRKVLKYRDKALPLIKTIIGDGAATKLWLDNWHPFGVLLNRFGSRICYDAGSYSLAARHACVKEIVRDGDWYPGPSTSFNLIDIWRALPTIEKFHDEVPDLTVWIGNSSGNFTSKSAWNAVRTRTARDWSEAVWFERGLIPIAL